MTFKNEWLSTLALIFMYLSCVIVALGAIDLSMTLLKGEVFPVRKIIILLMALVFWFVIASFSNDPAWKALLKFFSNSLTIISLCVFVKGLMSILNMIVGRGNEMGLSISLIFVFIGGLSFFGLTKVLKSKWLK